MSRNVTLGTLRARVQRRVDIESATARFTVAELNDVVNEGIAALWERIARARGHDGYYRKSQAFTTLSNQSNYDLATIGAGDFYHLVSIDVVIGGANLVLTARPFMENERNRFKFLPTGWNYGHPIYYELQGNQISFIPNPSGGFQCTLNYVPVSPTLVSDSDTFDGISGWEEYAVLWAAERCAVKQRQLDMAGYLSGMLAREEERIRIFCAERDDQPERVHDVTCESSWEVVD